MDNTTAHIRSEFDAQGFGLIVIAFFMYFFYAGWTVDGMNIFIPALVKAKGWEAGTLLSLAGVGGMFSVLGSAVFGHLAMSRGPRFVVLLCLLASAPAVLAFGHINELWQFAAVFIAINFFGAGFGYIAPGNLIVQWFPTKKGMALALATCGFPAATAAFIPLAALSIDRLGLPGAGAIWAAAITLIAAVAWFTVRNSRPRHAPEPAAQPQVADARAQRELPLRTLIADRTMWLISLGWGCLWLVTVGIVVQLVPRLVELGYGQSEAIGYLSVAALCALPGSLIWGYLDQRLGTRLASIAYALLYIVTLLILIFAHETKIFVLVAILLVGLGLGGIKSLITSMVGTAYGQAGFASAYRVIMPLSIIVRTLAFPIMGIAVSKFGTLSAAYAAFVVIDVLAILLIIAANKPAPKALMKATT